MTSAELIQAAREAVSGTPRDYQGRVAVVPSLVIDLVEEVVRMKAALSAIAVGGAQSEPVSARLARQALDGGA